MSDESPDAAALDALRRRTARAAAARPGYLAAIFARYQAAERIGDDELARRLGVEAGALPALALCRSPRAERFAADSSAISDRFGADRAALAGILRHVAALDALASVAGADVLMAARDADDDAPPEDDR